MSKAMSRNRKYARTVRIFDPELRLLTEGAYGHLLTAGYDVQWISERSCEVLSKKTLRPNQAITARTQSAGKGTT